MKIFEATLDSSRYIYIIIDLADQSAHSLPPFTVQTKAESGTSIEVRLVGTLQHEQPNQYLLKNMKETFESASNQILQALHRILHKQMQLLQIHCS